MRRITTIVLSLLVLGGCDGGSVKDRETRAIEMIRVIDVTCREIRTDTIYQEDLKSIHRMTCRSKIYIVRCRQAATVGGAADPECTVLTTIELPGVKP